MIEGVGTKSLKLIPDERGWLMEMLRNNDPLFIKFGQIYATATYPGVIKGWHLHTRQTQNYAVISGMIKLVLYDPRESSNTKGEVQELFIGEDNYCLVRIPPGIYNGFKAYGVQPAIVANCPTEPHDPDEMERLDPSDPSIPYDWSLVHR